MNIDIIEIQTKEKKYKKFLWFKIPYKEKSIIKLSFNLEENRIYYIDNKKAIPTKKDLARSLEIIHDIYSRYCLFDKDKFFKIKEDNIENFISVIVSDKKYDYRKLLFGTSDYNLAKLDSICYDMNLFHDFRTIFSSNKNLINYKNIFIDY